MAGMDGVTFLTRVRAMRPNAARVVLSGSAWKSSLDGARLLAHEVLSKPCPTAALVASCARRIERYINATNVEPRPFVCAKSADEILATVITSARARLRTRILMVLRTQDTGPVCKDGAPFIEGSHAQTPPNVAQDAHWRRVGPRLGRRRGRRGSQRPLPRRRASGRCADAAVTRAAPPSPEPFA
jgi:hypothetical protein